MENPNRIKITEILETKFRYRRYRDANGQEHQTHEPYQVYREVQVVSGWARFGHYLLDGVFIWVLQALVGFLIGLVGGMTGSMRAGDEMDLGFRIGLTFVNMFVMLLYYGIFELMFASTPAKMILGRIVIDEYGLKPEPAKIIGRTFSRLVPFEAFSCLADRGWHDTWSKTFVVRKEEAEQLWNLLNQAELQRTQQQADQFRKTQEGPTI